MNWISFKCQVFINTLTFREKENAAPVRSKDVFNNRLKVTTKLQKTHCNPLICTMCVQTGVPAMISLGSLLAHQRSLLTSLVMPNSDPRDRSFYPTLTLMIGAQWLSGRVLDSRPKGRGFEPHRRHCVVVLEQDTFIQA